MNFGDHDGSRAIENRLHGMRGDASRAPDLSGCILSRIAEKRPFADGRTLKLRRWGRMVGMGFACGLAVCAAVVVVQWPQIAPGLSKPRPVQGVVSSAVADVRAGSRTLKTAQARLTLLARSAETRTDPEDSTVVRAVTSNVIVPMGAVLRVTPTLETTETEQNLAQRFIAGGQRMLDKAERIATAFKPGNGVMGGVVGGVRGGGDSMGGSETFADRLGRAVGGAPLIDGGPQ